MALPTGQGYTAAQWEAYLTANTNPANPDYTGSAVLKNGTPLKGKTWAQVYAAFYAENSGETPDQIAVDVEALGFEEALAVGTQSTVTGVAGATEAAQGTAKGAVQNPAVEAAAAVTTTLGEFQSVWSTLTSANLWIRIVKVVAGGTLLIVGLAHITGTGDKVTAAAKALGNAPIPGLAIAARGVAAVSAKAKSSAPKVKAKTRAASLSDVHRAAKGK